MDEAAAFWKQGFQPATEPLVTKPLSTAANPPHSNVSVRAALGYKNMVYFSNRKVMRWPRTPSDAHGSQRMFAR